MVGGSNLDLYCWLAVYGLVALYTERPLHSYFIVSVTVVSVLMVLVHVGLVPSHSIQSAERKVFCGCECAAVLVPVGAPDFRMLTKVAGLSATGKCLVPPFPGDRPGNWRWLILPEKVSVVSPAITVDASSLLLVVATELCSRTLYYRAPLTSSPLYTPSKSLSISDTRAHAICYFLYLYEVLMYTQ